MQVFKVNVMFEKGLQISFLFELPHMWITWYCDVQSHMYIKYSIR